MLDILIHGRNSTHDASGVETAAPYKRGDLACGAISSMVHAGPVRLPRETRAPYNDAVRAALLAAGGRSCNNVTAITEIRAP